jgi:hypothetical protein
MAVTLKGDVEPGGFWGEDIVRVLQNVRDVLNELQADHATFKTATDDLKTLLNSVRNALAGDSVLGKAVLAIGSTPTAVASGAFFYLINGVLYQKAAVTAGTAPGNDVIPQAKYGAVAFDIGADGTIDAVEATANATGYDSAVLAVAGLPAVASDHVRMGYVTATKSDGAFTFGTTQLDAANSTVAYTDTGSALASVGAAVSSSAPASLTNSTAITLNKG